MATFELSRATVTHKRRWLGIAFATWLVPLLGYTGSLFLHPALAEGAHLWGLAGLLLVTLALTVLLHRWRATRTGTVAVDGDVLFVDGKAVTKRRDIRSALVVPQRGESVVRLLRRWSHVDVEIVTPRRAEARALVLALRVGAEQRASSFVVAWGRFRSQQIGGRLFGFALPLGLAGVSLLSSMRDSQRVPKHGLLHAPWLLPMTAGFVLLSVLGFVAFAVRTRTTITVGSDGVLVRRGMGQPLFLPYAQIVRVDATDLVSESCLQIVCRDRAPVVCHLGVVGVVASVAAKNRELMRAIACAIEEAKRGRTEQQAIPKTALTRSGRDAHAWVRALHDAAVEAAGYRVQAIPTEALWNIVCDSDAPATERAGAAVVSRANLDEDGRARLRVASATSAYPQLRIALAAAADEADEDALVEALAPLSDEPRSRAASSRG